MTRQEEASLLLQQWQALRALAPDERIERLMSDYFRPPIELDCRYQDQLNAVDEAMQERPIDWTIARDLAAALALNFGALAVIGIIGWEIFRP